MEREHINPPELFRYPGFTHILTVADPAKLVFFAGEVSAAPDGSCVGVGDYLLQYRQIMENLTVQLAAVGAGWDDVVFARRYTVDVASYRAAASNPDNPRYWDPERPPPSTLLGVAALAQPEFLIEIEIVAALSQ